MSKLTKRVEVLQKKERDLLQSINKIQNGNPKKKNNMSDLNEIGLDDSLDEELN